MKGILINKLNSKDACIGIIGLGYVGQPLLLRYSEVGYKVLGFDINRDVISALNRGESHIEHISSEAVAAAVANGFEATDDFSRAQEVDALLLCVPTPLNTYREPDLSFVIGTLENLLPHMKKGQTLSLESTTWPGTTEEVLRPMLEERGFTIGENLFLIYSPEREDPGNPKFTTKDIPKVVGGSTPACLEVGKALYEQIVNQVVPVSSTRAAEMTKLLENIHRAVNIGLANEMKVVADRMGIDIYEVIRAAATKPFGFVPYYPGPGLGGHCIPIDPFYLTWKAREYGLHTRFIELAGEVNASMPEYVVNKVSRALNDKARPVRGSRILVLGVAYKKNVDDMRESPSVEIMELLRDLGAELAYHDPYVPQFPRMRQHHFNLSSIELTPEALAGFDCVVLATDHDDFDYDMIRENARLIVDTRGRYLEPADHIIKA